MTTPREPTFYEALESCVKDVYEDLGSGMTECIYRKALSVALRRQGFGVEEEVCVPIYFDTHHAVGSLRADLVVGFNHVIELKVARSITDAHCAQARAYMRHSPMAEIHGFEIDGFVVNFGGDDFEVHEVKLPKPKKRKRDAEKEEA